MVSPIVTLAPDPSTELTVMVKPPIGSLKVFPGCNGASQKETPDWTPPLSLPSGTVSMR